jgi:hypothetical protein
MDLRFGFAFEDLYAQEGLARLDQVFVEQLRHSHAPLHDRLLTARTHLDVLSLKQQSELIIELAPHVEDFLGELFGISPEIGALQAQHNDLAPLYAAKRRFVQKKALTGMTKERAEAIDGPAVALELEERMSEALTERSFAIHVLRWMEDEKNHPNDLAKAAEYAAWATLSAAGSARYKHGILFRLPHKLDPLHLVPVEKIEIGGVSRFHLPETEWRQREGFALTDPGMDLAHALDQANYCIKCHNQAKDSCRTGLKEKDGPIRKACSE